MQVKVFTIPTSDDGTLQNELNKFLANHKILETEQKFYDNDKGGYWSFCVRYIADTLKKSAPSQQSFSGKSKPKLNYKEILSEDEHKAFLQYKQVRMEISKEDGVLPYNVFTDAELAEIVKLADKTESAVAKINGIGEKRVEKYYKKMAEKYAYLQNVGAGLASPENGSIVNFGGQTPPLPIATQSEILQ